MAQCIDQIANRALVHAGHAREFEVTTQHGQCRGQRAHGGTCVAEKQRGGGVGKTTAQTGDMHCRAVFTDFATQRPQRNEHYAGVVRIQQVMDCGGALAHRCQQQHAVGNTFGAGEGDCARGALQRWQVQKFSGKHNLKCWRQSKFSRFAPETWSFPQSCLLIHLGRHGPVGAGFTGLFQQAFQRFDVAAGNHQLQGLQVALENFALFQ